LVDRDLIPVAHPARGHSERRQSSAPALFNSTMSGSWNGVTPPGNAPETATLPAESVVTPGSARIGHALRVELHELCLGARHVRITRSVDRDAAYRVRIVEALEPEQRAILCATW
jgi:hypothetical protein